MKIPATDWRKYIDRLSKLSGRAAEEMRAYIDAHGLDDRNALIDYAYGLTTKYGEGAGAMAAEMYDAVSEVSRANVPAAVVADTPRYGEVAKTVHGVLKQSQNPDTLSNSIGRLVKRTGADTTLKNALRDGAQFAWIPNGDTCAFCITLASRGWQYMSKKALKNGHAEHIHANCDCTYAIRHDKRSSVEGYDPARYRKIYEGADGKTPQERVNAIRRNMYAADPDKYREKKRAAYALKQTGGKMAGGHHYSTEDAFSAKEKRAAEVYEEFSRVDDSSLIAGNTGFSREDIIAVRRHLFFKKHDLDDGFGRFDPDYDMAVAWRRLQSGDFLPRDITLLNHELLESRLEKEYNLSARDAHEMAQKTYDWASQLLRETEGKGEKDGVL